MNILISGGTGLVGTGFSHWVQNHINHAVPNQAADTKQQKEDESTALQSQVKITWLTRDTNQSHPGFVDMMSYEQLRTTNRVFDIVINLAGAGIADKRWNEARKQVLMESRLQTTQALLDYIERIEQKPKLLLTSSAIGWYGNQGDTPLDERSQIKPQQNVDFAQHLCDTWEKKAKQALTFNVPVIILRTGVVIHPEGGMIAKILPLFKLGLGGKLGDGNQYMSWISLYDWVRAAWYIIQYHLQKGSVESVEDNSSMSTIYNLTAPNPVRNKEFTKEVGHWLQRPTFMTVPAKLLTMLLGDMADMFVNGQKLLPKHLLDIGFEFQYPEIRQALEQQDSLERL